jgi:hypothetical protein
MLPKSLLVLAAVLVIAFLGSIVGSVRKKSSELARYQKIPGVPNGRINELSNFAPTVVDPASSYQHQHNHYALPSKKKEVTYCVIDGRLVDS